MKIAYIKPSIEVVKFAWTNSILNSGSVYTYGNSSPDTTIGSGTEPLPDGDGVIWIDSKKNNMWDDE